MEALLIAKLVPPNEDEATHLAGYGNNNNDPSSSYANGSNSNGKAYAHHRSRSSYRNQEIFVRPGPGWRGGLARARVNYPSTSSLDESNSYDDDMGQVTVNGQRPMSAGNTGLETPDEPQSVLHSCRREMIQLWNDEGIRDVLRRRKIRLEEDSGL